MDNPSPLDLLEFYQLAGVDTLIEEELYNYELAPEIKHLLTQELPVILPMSQPHRVTSSNIEQLFLEYRSFEGCSLKRTAKSFIEGRGQLEPDLMIIGDAPDADEDREGQALYGASGDLLTRMMAAINLEINTLYFSPFIPWRPAGGQAATPAHIAACLPFLKQMIKLVEPKKLLILGAPTAHALLNLSAPLLKIRGEFYDYEGIKAFVTLPPALLLHQPSFKKMAWLDLLTLKAGLSDQ